MRKLDYKTVLKQCNEYQELQLIKYKIICKILEVLKNFDGKAFSKRMETALRKSFDLDEELKPYTVSYRLQYDMYHIDVYGGLIKKADSFFSTLIGYTSQEVFNFSKCLEHSQCYTLELTRYEKLESVKNKIEAMVNVYNTAMDLLTEIHNVVDVGDSIYPLSKIFIIKQEGDK